MSSAKYVRNVSTRPNKREAERVSTPIVPLWNRSISFPGHSVSCKTARNVSYERFRFFSSYFRYTESLLRREHSFRVDCTRFFSPRTNRRFHFNERRDPSCIRFYTHTHIYKYTFRDVQSTIFGDGKNLEGSSLTFRREMAATRLFNNNKANEIIVSARRTDHRID